MHRSSIALTALAILTAISAACGDDEVIVATGGSGGDGGTTTSDGGTSTSTGGTTSTSTTHPTCLGTQTLTAVHGCDPATNLTDMSGMGEVSIGYGFVNGMFVYEPKCLLVDSGTTVRMDPIGSTNFGIHPLQGGTAPTPDPNSPFPFIADSNVTSTSFVLDACGTFPYYCVAHAGSGMVGAVYVQPK